MVGMQSVAMAAKLDKSFFEVPSVDPTTQLLLSQIGQLNPQQVTTTINNGGSSKFWRGITASESICNGQHKQGLWWQSRGL
jgi:hypothetical protein